MFKHSDDYDNQRGYVNDSAGCDLSSAQRLDDHGYDVSAFDGRINDCDLHDGWL